MHYSFYVEQSIIHIRVALSYRPVRLDADISEGLPHLRHYTRCTEAVFVGSLNRRFPDQILIDNRHAALGRAVVP